jgi:hypothetical protein
LRGLSHESLVQVISTIESGVGIFLPGQRLFIFAMIKIFNPKRNGFQTMNHNGKSSTALLVEYHCLVEQLDQNGSNGNGSLKNRQLAELALQLSPEILRQYKRVYERYKSDGGHAVFEVTNGCCWCHCKLPTKHAVLLRSKIILACENCGRLLVQKSEENSSSL